MFIVYPGLQLLVPAALVTISVGGLIIRRKKPVSPKFLAVTKAGNTIIRIEDRTGKFFLLHDWVQVKEGIDPQIPSDAVGEIHNILPLTERDLRSQCIEVWFNTLKLVRVLGFDDLLPATPQSIAR